MGKIIKYKDEMYDFQTLSIMIKDSNFNKSMDFTKDEIELTDTGETIMLKDLPNERFKRNSEIRQYTKHLSQYHRNKISKIMNDDEKLINKAELWNKFKENIITIEELEDLMVLENKDLNIKYIKGFYVNKTKDKPDNLSDDYYGKFFRLLHLMNYGNTIRHDNANPIKKKDIYTALGMKTERAFEIFLKKIKSCGMIAKTERNIRGKSVNYLIINPAYASANITIDNTIYNLFKDDLEDMLSELEIKYLEMKNETSTSPMLSYV